MSEDHYPKKELHFIIGIGRSGTTIMNKVLNDHPQIHCLPEATFLAFFLHEFQNKTTYSSDDIDLILDQINIYSKTHPWVGWKFDRVETRKKLIHKISEGDISYEEICKLIYEQFEVEGIPKDMSSILLDKNPSYTLFAGKLAKAIPGSKFILLVRDYRANVLSRKQSPYLNSPDVAFNACRWKIFNEIAFEFMKDYQERVLLVKYEDFVLDNENQLKKILKFLNVNEELEKTETSSEINVNVKDFNFPEKYRNRFTKKYSDLNRNINPDRLEAWKTQLSDAEIKICDAICSPTAIKFGYVPLNKMTSVVKLRIYLLHFLSIFKANAEVKKNFLIYYVPASLKLKRLKAKYRSLGF